MVDRKSLPLMCSSGLGWTHVNAGTGDLGNSPNVTMLVLGPRLTVSTGFGSLFSFNFSIPSPALRLGRNILGAANRGHHQLMGVLWPQDITPFSEADG